MVESEGNSKEQGSVDPKVQSEESSSVQKDSDAQKTSGSEGADKAASHGPTTADKDSDGSTSAEKPSDGEAEAKKKSCDELTKKDTSDGSEIVDKSSSSDKTTSDGSIAVEEATPDDSVAGKKESSLKKTNGKVGARRKSEDSKEKKALVFPKFEVFGSPDKELLQPKSKRRSSGSSSPSFVGNDPYRPPEMSPETTLIEFISCSAAYHGVKKQNMRQLEWDILKVFVNNVMPANAAAWYMAKRRYYFDNAWEHQLLPFLLKKYPDKFFIRNQSVEFLEVCPKDVAKKKMTYMVNQGLYAYFSHKVDEYGVYFFDPSYYEHTEPFHANLRIATNFQVGHKSRLVPSFFSQYEKNFVFKRHNPYLVSLSKVQTPIEINTTGIIVSMLDKNYGIIQFPSGLTTEKALFCIKSLYSDGWLYSNDPLKLDAIKFDGYRIPGPEVPGREYTWYAVLVWIGRKPSPKFCSSKDDLTPSTLVHKQDIPFFSPVMSPPATKSPSKSVSEEGMIIGEIVEIRKTGAVVTMQSKDSKEKAFIMGWRHENLRKKGYFLTTTQGVGLGINDLVGYYIDPNHKVDSFATVAHQVIVLKQGEEAANKSNNMSHHPLRLDMGGSPNTRNGILRQLANMGLKTDGGYSSPNNPPSLSILAASEMNAWKLLRKMEISKYAEEEDKTYKPDGDSVYSSGDSSNYDSFDEAEEITDGELNFLRDGIMDLIVQENKDANDWRLSFLQKIMQETSNLINTRSLRRGVMKRRPATPSSSHDSGHATSAEVTPTGNGPFWRVEKAFRRLDKRNYTTDEDIEGFSEGSKGSSSLFKKNIELEKKVPLDWSESLASFEEIRYCIHSKKWIPNPALDSDDESDRSYTPREVVDNLESDEEVSENELEFLLEDAKKETLDIIPSTEPSDVEKEEKETLDATDGESSKEKVPSKERTRKPRKTIPMWIRYITGMDKSKPGLSKDRSRASKSKRGSLKNDPTNNKEEGDKVISEDAVDQEKSSKKDEEAIKPLEEENKDIVSMSSEIKDEADTSKVVEDKTADATMPAIPEEDDYNSDLDPEYIPPPQLDSDVDYDEYSDGEICDEELRLLGEEKEILLGEELVGPCNCSKAPSTEARKNKRRGKDCSKTVMAGKEVTLAESSAVEEADADKKDSPSKEKLDELPAIVITPVKVEETEEKEASTTTTTTEVSAK